MSLLPCLKTMSSIAALWLPALPDFLVFGWIESWFSDFLGHFPLFEKLKPKKKKRDRGEEKIGGKDEHSPFLNKSFPVKLLLFCMWITCTHKGMNEIYTWVQMKCAHRCDWTVSTQVWITSVRCYTLMWLSCVHSGVNNFSKMLHTLCDQFVCTQVWLNCVCTGVNIFSKMLHTDVTELCAHRCYWAVSMQVWITSVRCCYTVHRCDWVVCTWVWLSCVHAGVNNFNKVLHTCCYTEFLCTQVWPSCVHAGVNNFNKMLHSTQMWLSCVHAGVNNFSKMLHTGVTGLCSCRCE